MKTIKLRNADAEVIVDDHAYDELMRVSRGKFWAAISDGKITGVYFSSRSHRTIYVGRYLMKTTRRLQCDHINRNPLCCLISNMRNVTQTINQLNIPLRLKRGVKPSKYNGVSWKKVLRKWRAAITINGEHYHLSYFKDEILAAIAYDDAAILAFGQFARLNFPLVIY